MTSIEKLNGILDNFHEKKILVIGDLMVDNYILGDVSRLSPEAPVPVVDVKEETMKLGGSANVINNIIYLGGKVFPIGVVGKDSKGNWLLNEFVKRGMDLTGILVDERRPTTTKTRVMAGQHQLIRIDYELKNNIGTKEESTIFQFFKSKIDDIDCIVMVDYDKGVFTSNLIEFISKTAQKKKKITLASPKRNHYLEYKNMTLIKSNATEAYTASNIHLINNVSLKDVGTKLLNELQCNALLITQGKDGMTLFEKKHEFFNIPTFVKEVYDVTGAGDVVTAALALCLSSGSPFKEASIISNAAAGVKVGKVGTATVNLSELRNQLTTFN
ncbi:D-glycero-beta-D-manno-heptose-7-phosphate kinase, partial [Candidatus Bathyarchaeota archaeon]|nr:D-glycero-beta-D-manno-heptose-7-phosphate kinase [Candidatus Bathyarchaeota archaeon]